MFEVGEGSLDVQVGVPMHTGVHKAVVGQTKSGVGREGCSYRHVLTRNSGEFRNSESEPDFPGQYAHIFA